MNQLNLLREIYTAHPCRTLPNAFWKTAAHIAESSLVVTTRGGEDPSALVIWEGERLMALWCADPADHPLKQVDIGAVSFALVHDNALPVFAQRDFAVQRPYFRLVHAGGIEDTLSPPGFTFERFYPEVDIDAVVKLILASYDNIRVSPEIVKAWMDQPVYDPDLWLWVVDIESGEKAGLGIADRDPQVPEASLEWIQVLPGYRGKGLGKAIVRELLHRVSDSVKFTTVAGELENVHQPERLYRQCGFTGEDVWWLLSDKV
jgi:GNAT superfamily N-acetyltransferase